MKRDRIEISRSGIPIFTTPSLTMFCSFCYPLIAEVYICDRQWDHHQPGGAGVDAAFNSRIDNVSTDSSLPIGQKLGTEVNTKLSQW